MAKVDGGLMPSKIIRAPVGVINRDTELRWQQVLAVDGFAQQAGVPFSSELMSAAKFTDLPAADGYVRQLVELDL